MATVSYSWTQIVAPFFVNDALTSGNQSQPAIASLAGGGYFGAWSAPSLDYVEGRVINADGTADESEFLVNSTTAGAQFDASIAGLANGNFVVTFTDSSPGFTTIRARLFDADGDPLGNNFLVALFGTDPLGESDVTALANGGFAVSFTRETSSGDLDPYVQRFNASGTAVGGAILVEDGNTTQFSGSASSIVGLAGGGFVVAYELVPDFPSDPDNPPHYAEFRLFNADGTPHAGSNLFDDIGLINQDLQVTALPDGGFVVAYTDSGWSADGTTDVTVKVFNADGSSRSGFIRANQSSVIVGDQDKPSVTTLSNGFFVVSWTDEASDALYQQAFDANGNPVGDDFLAGGQTIEGEIASLGSGIVANVRSSLISDGSGASIRSSITELTRTTNGTAADETLTGDSLRDVINAGGGDDLLKGGGGKDTLNGGVDIDTADYRDKTTSVEVTLTGGSFATVKVDGVAEDTIKNVENVYGGSGADTLVGDGQANGLYGGDSDDLLKGGTGADTLSGQGGVDTADYRDKSDAVVVTLNGSSNATVTVGGVAEDTITKIENVYGGSGADTLTGDGFANGLYGGGANDLLNGGGGNDLLSGQAGADTFLFNTALNAATNLDHVKDFAAEDTIKLENGIFTALTTTGTLSANAFYAAAGATSAQDSTDRIVYNTTTGALYYDADGSGEAAAVQFAVLDNQAALTNADFVIV